MCHHKKIDFNDNQLQKMLPVLTNKDYLYHFEKQNFFYWMILSLENLVLFELKFLNEPNFEGDNFIISKSNSFCSQREVENWVEEKHFIFLLETNQEKMTFEREERIKKSNELGKEWELNVRWSVTD